MEQAQDTTESRFVRVLGQGPTGGVAMLRTLNDNDLYVVPGDYIRNTESLRTLFEQTHEQNQNLQRELEHQRNRVADLALELQASRHLTSRWELRFSRIKEVLEEI